VRDSGAQAGGQKSKTGAVERREEALKERPVHTGKENESQGCGEAEEDERSRAAAAGGGRESRTRRGRRPRKRAQ